jgi:Predicted transcriptional regulators
MLAMDRLLPHVTGAAFSPDDLGALQAIAEPNRARIIELLGHGEHCVCDVGEALAMSSALVSHHLRVLRASRLLHERRNGRWVFYALDLDRLAMVRAAVVGLLTPTDAAASSCVCSDCGPTRESAPIPGDPLGTLPVLTGTAR